MAWLGLYSVGVLGVLAGALNVFGIDWDGVFVTFCILDLYIWYFLRQKRSMLCLCKLLNKFEKSRSVDTLGLVNLIGRPCTW